MPTATANTAAKAIIKEAILVTFPVNDRCQSCGKGKAEHEYTALHKGKMETLNLCFTCLMAEDGATDCNADLASEAEQDLREGRTYIDYLGRTRSARLDGWL